MNENVRAEPTEKLCAALRRDWSCGRPDDDQEAEQIAAEATFHGVDVLLAELVRSAPPDAWPRPSQDRLTLRLREAIVVEELRARALRTLLGGLATAGLNALLIKGGALAYTHYPAPYLRPRTDTDLLIARDALESTERILTGLGYARSVEPDAELASYQRHYARRLSGGIPDAVDVHWKAANPQRFADALDDMDALVARSVPIAALGTTARTLSVADSLLLACLHRVAHHQDRPDLLWLWDIHLLVSHAKAEDLQHFARLAERSAMRAVSARGLGLARAAFGTAVPLDVFERLDVPWNLEPSAHFLGGGLRQLDILSSDLAAAGTWQRKLMLLREHLFPPFAYMRGVYPRWPRPVLPLAYLHRVVRGAPKWFRRPPAD